jgi:hypothetical protein
LSDAVKLVKSSNALIPEIPTKQISPFWAITHKTSLKWIAECVPALVHLTQHVMIATIHAVTSPCFASVFLSSFGQGPSLPCLNEVHHFTTEWFCTPLIDAILPAYPITYSRERYSDLRLRPQTLIENISRKQCLPITESLPPSLVWLLHSSRIVTAFGWPKGFHNTKCRRNWSKRWTLGSRGIEGWIIGIIWVEIDCSRFSRRTWPTVWESRFISRPRDRGGRMGSGLWEIRSAQVSFRWVATSWRGHED